MNMAKATNEKKLKLCQTYFRIGMACLPLVWAVNACWFFKEAFKTPPYAEQERIRRYVLLSAMGTFFWLLVTIIWVITFQTKRAEWGAFADYMSFIIPLGMA